MLTAAAGAALSHTVEQKVGRELDRLLASGGRPALALSGGGDSTALLHMARHRDPLVLVVDHGLSTGSEARAKAAVDMAGAFGLETRRLRWEHPSTSRVQEAARVARYSLMGEACRAAGIGKLLVGHTRDDQSETLSMRRTRCADARAMDPVAYAPVWPGLRGVELLRPMLGVRRAELRRYLEAHGLPFHDDPANTDRRFERVRTRTALAGRSVADAPDRSREAERMLSEAGGLRWGQGYCDARGDVGMDVLALALTCVAGSEALIAPSRLGKLEARRALTVGGGRVVPVRGGYRLLRDPGGVLGRVGVNALPPLRIEAGRDVLWDNRFLVSSGMDVEVRPLGTVWPDGLARPHIDIRRTLPGAWTGGELVGVPGMEGPVAFRDVGEERFLGILQARAVPRG